MHKHKKTTVIFKIKVTVVFIRVDKWSNCELVCSYFNYSKTLGADKWRSDSKIWAKQWDRETQNWMEIERSKRKEWGNGSEERKTHQRDVYDLKRERDVGEEHGSIGPKILTEHQIIKFQLFRKINE